MDGLSLPTEQELLANCSAEEALALLVGRLPRVERGQVWRLSEGPSGQWVHVVKVMSPTTCVFLKVPEPDASLGYMVCGHAVEGEFPISGLLKWAWEWKFLGRA